MLDDLTPRQLAVLMTVAGNEGPCQTGIVDATGIDRSTLADPREEGTYAASAQGKTLGRTR